MGKKVRFVTDAKTTVVKVQIAGEEHLIKGNAPEEYILELGRIVDEKLRAIQQKSPNLTRHRMAVLAAINLADELQRVKAEYQELLKIMEEAN
jgi:cell division protein ZapA